MNRHQYGFTVLELLIIIVLFGILASTAMPQFQHIEEHAQETEVDDLLYRLSASIQVAKVTYMTQRQPAFSMAPDHNNNYIPDHLGDNGSPSQYPYFFAGVLEKPVPNASYYNDLQPGWRSRPNWLPSLQDGRYHYFYDADGNGRYDTSIDKRIAYDPATGQLSRE